VSIAGPLEIINLHLGPERTYMIRNWSCCCLGIIQTDDEHPDTAKDYFAIILSTYLSVANCSPGTRRIKYLF
jgi:hypothetical protein